MKVMPTEVEQLGAIRRTAHKTLTIVMNTTGGAQHGLGRGYSSGAHISYTNAGRAGSPAREVVTDAPAAAGLCRGREGAQCLCKANWLSKGAHPCHISSFTASATANAARTAATEP